MTPGCIILLSCTAAVGSLVSPIATWNLTSGLTRAPEGLCSLASSTLATAIHPLATRICTGSATGPRPGSELKPACLALAFGRFLRCSVLSCGSRFLEGSLGGRKASDGHAEGRAAYVGQARAMAEFHAVGIATVLAADAELDVRARLPAFFHRNLHQLAYTALVNRGKRILLHNFQLLIRRQE